MGGDMGVWRLMSGFVVRERPLRGRFAVLCRSVDALRPLRRLIGGAGEVPGGERDEGCGGVSGQAHVAHAGQPVRSLEGSEDALDAAANPPDQMIAALLARAERSILPAPVLHAVANARQPQPLAQPGPT